MEIYTADEGKVYRNKTNGITAKMLIIGKNDSIDNYEQIDEPVIEETEIDIGDNI